MYKDSNFSFIFANMLVSVLFFCDPSGYEILSHCFEIAFT